MFIENIFKKEEEKQSISNHLENSNSLYPRLSYNEMNVKTNDGESKKIIHPDPLKERFMSAQIQNKVEENQNHNRGERDCCCFLL